MRYVRSSFFSSKLMQRSLTVRLFRLPSKEKETNGPAAAMELPDGKIVCGKTSDLLGASAALLLNALKELAGIDHELHVISPDAIHPIQQLKTKYLGSKNPRLHIDEILIALSMSAATSDAARLALEQIPNLRGCQAHTSVMLSDVDVISFRKLGVELTCEAKAEKKKNIRSLNFINIKFPAPGSTYKRRTVQGIFLRESIINQVCRYFPI